MLRLVIRHFNFKVIVQHVHELIPKCNFLQTNFAQNLIETRRFKVYFVLKSKYSSNIESSEMSKKSVKLPTVHGHLLTFLKLVVGRGEKLLYTIYMCHLWWSQSHLFQQKEPVSRPLTDQKIRGNPGNPRNPENSTKVDMKSCLMKYVCTPRPPKRRLSDRRDSKTQNFFY